MYGVLEDRLDVKNTALFCFSKWKSLEKSIKSGKSLSDLKHLNPENVGAKFYGGNCVRNIA